MELIIKQQVKEIAEKALSEGKVDVIIGWAKGEEWWDSYPTVIRRAEEAKDLIWDSFCVTNLSKYLLKNLAKDKKVGLFVKGCDSRAFNQMLADQQIDRSKVVLFGIPCSGLVNPDKVREKGWAQGLVSIKREGENLIFMREDGAEKAQVKNFYYDKCEGCTHPNPVVFDHLLGEQVPTQSGDNFADVKRIEALDIEERFKYWSGHFSRCLRCFACRNICPACSCQVCIFENTESALLGKSTELSETQFYQIIRAYHVAGRCVDCGECARVCPVGIPLQELNRKLSKDLQELYGEYEAGVNPSKESPLVTYQINDPDSFDGH